MIKVYEKTDRGGTQLVRMIEESHPHIELGSVAAPGRPVPMSANRIDDGECRRLRRAGSRMNVGRKPRFRGTVRKDSWGRPILIMRKDLLHQLRREAEYCRDAA